MRDQVEIERAVKRGGGVTPAPLEDLDALRLEPWVASHDSPDLALDRAWARDVFSRALKQLEEAWTGRAPLFAALRLSLEGAPTAANYAAIGASLGMTEGAVGKAAHDLRRQFATLVRAEVRATVRDEADVDSELRHLVMLLRQ